MKKMVVILSVLALCGFAQASVVINFEGNNGFTSYGTMPSTYQPVSGLIIGYTNVGTYSGSGTWNTWQTPGGWAGPQVFTFDKAVKIESVDLCQYDPSATTITAKAYSDMAGNSLLGSFAVAIPAHTGGGGQNYVWKPFTDFAQYGTTIQRITFAAAGGYNPNAQVDNIVLSVIPEPATMSLLALGGLAMLRKRK